MSVPVVGTLIGGSWVESDDWIEIRDPADVSTPVARVPALTADEVAAAYDAAERGFNTWRRASAFDRADCLLGAGRLLRQRIDVIAPSIVGENGKRLAEARGEVAKAADFLEYYASLARSSFGRLLNEVRPGTTASVRREPVGIVLAITPWNDPLLTPARKLAPALMCGNSVVLKPASETPLSALHLARALHDAGLPDGVVNVVTGHSRNVADVLVADERIAAVSFTGGNEVGEQLRSQLAPRNLRFQAEMGGKNASVVLADADLEAAADALVSAAFGGAGQRCTATSRLLVDRVIAASFVEMLVQRIADLRVGPGLSVETTLGPLVSPIHRDSVLDHIQRAQQQGAEVLTGGTAPEDESLASGCYVLPTVLSGVAPDMDIWREEVFGPVIVVSEIEGIDGAVDAVNDSMFGLSAAIFTDSLAAAERFIDEVECGQIAVNATTSGWDVHIPFGGFRRSGSPFKEQGEEAINFYTRVKSVVVHVPQPAV